MKKFLDDYPRGIEDTAFSRVLLTSDLHFRHDRIHEFEPIREDLRLADGFVGSPDEYLIHTWNSQVNPQDLVVNLGDLHWKSLEPIAYRLNGTMLLVLGNHDNAAAYYDHYPHIYAVKGVWNLNGTPKEYYIPHSTDKLLSGFIYKDAFFTHYPLYGIDHEYNYQRKGAAIVPRMETLLSILDNEPEMLYNIHGHLHSNTIDSRLSLNTCIDFNKYKLLDFMETMSEVRRQ